MDPTKFIKILHGSHWSETVLTLLRDDSIACYKVDTGSRDTTTNQIDYSFWNRKVQQSQMEISIVNLLIDYIKGNFSAATNASTSAAPSTEPTSSFTESTTLAASSSAPNLYTTTTLHMINPH